MPDTPRPSDAPQPADAPRSPASPLTHFDAAGHAHMVDVAGKADTRRIARATGTIRMQAATLALIRAGNAAKGDVIGIARIAAIQGAKRTADLIPLCHPIAITRIAVEFELAGAEAGDTASDLPALVRCTAQVECTGKTGVEMEALTAVQVALLTIYDMCKAADRGMVITGVRLLEKQGGRSGHWIADDLAGEQAGDRTRTPIGERADAAPSTASGADAT